MDKNIAIKLMNGEYKEVRAELCVNCKMYDRYVPIIRNCVTSNIREDGKRGTHSVRLHGEPSDFWHDLQMKCEFAKGVTSGPTSGDLKDIVCGYKKEKISS